jgi:5-methylcytosine-specific restriction endonuclease McrA
MAVFKGAVLNCLECGKEFKIPQCRIKTAKFCSTECADTHRNDLRKVDKIEKLCLHCGKPFSDHPCHAERRKYCSYECANKEFEKLCTLQEGMNEFYDCAFWKRLRSLVLERDNYRCQKCGEDKKVIVHHVQPRRAGGEDKENNLISLCPICHRKEHKSYDYLRFAS